MGRLVPMQVGNVEVLVDAIVPPGWEPASDRHGEVTRGVAQAMDRAYETIVELGVRTAHTAKELAARSTRPDRVDVEFGLSFTSSGGVVVVSGGVAASLKVTMSFTTNTEPSPQTAG